MKFLNSIMIGVSMCFASMQTHADQVNYGACCVQIFCEELPESVCNTIDGSFQGVGSTCPHDFACDTTTILNVPSDFETLADAVDHLPEDLNGVKSAIIKIAAGTYTITEEAVISTAWVSIIGAVNEDGSPAVTFDMKQDCRPIRVINGLFESPTIVQISNIIFNNGKSATGCGGALYFGGMLEGSKVSNCEFNNCSGLGGGAIYMAYGSLEIDNCSFHQNTAELGNGGSILTYNANLDVESCGFTESTAKLNGGGIYLGGPSAEVQLSNTNFEYNYVEKSGGGIYVEDGVKVKLLNSVFADNKAVYDGPPPDGMNMTECPDESPVEGEGGGAIYTAGNSDLDFFMLTTKICENCPLDDQVFGEYCAEDEVVIWNCEAPATEASCCVNNSCTMVDSFACSALGGTFYQDAECPDCTGFAVKECFGDINKDGRVEMQDLLILFSHWGVCP